jgi:hypothetical protein
MFGSTSFLSLHRRPAPPPPSPSIPVADCLFRCVPSCNLACEIWIYICSMKCEVLTLTLIYVCLHGGKKRQALCVDFPLAAVENISRSLRLKTKTEPKLLGTNLSVSFFPKAQSVVKKTEIPNRTNRSNRMPTPTWYTTCEDKADYDTKVAISLKFKPKQ